MKIDKALRLQILQQIFEDLQQITQWLPSNIDLGNESMIKAKALIEMLEIDDCGSVGGFDKNNRLKRDSGFDLYDRFTTVLRKHHKETDIEKCCNFTVESLKGYFQNLSTLRERSYGAEHPVERLKNHLTPIFNLIAMLHSQNVELPDRKLNKIYQEEINKCHDNLVKIKKYLEQAHNLK